LYLFKTKKKTTQKQCSRSYNREKQLEYIDLGLFQMLCLNKKDIKRKKNQVQK